MTRDLTAHTALARANPERAAAAEKVVRDLRLPTGPRRFDVRNPATGDVVAAVPDADPADALHAVSVAEAAGHDWAARTPRARADILRRWYELLIAHAEDIALLITREMGKPRAESRAEVTYGRDFVRW